MISNRTTSRRPSTERPATTCRPRQAHTDRRLLGTALFVVTAVVVASAGCVANDGHQPPNVNAPTTGKLDQALQRIATSEPDRGLRVIVRTDTGDLDRLERAVTESGGRVVERFAVIDALTVEVGSDRLLALATSPVVASVSTDGVVESAKKDKGGKKKKGGGPNNGNWKTESLDENHLLNTLGLAEESWDGKGVTVAVVDSGTVEGKPFCGQWDFREGADPAFNRGEPGTDPYGHGSHVAGLIGNDSRDTGGLYRGVAPRLHCLYSLYSLRVLDDNGVGYTSDVIRALLWVLENEKKAKVDVINLSLGHPILEPAASDPLVLAVEAVVRSGIVVVASAGNYGYDRATGEVGYAGITSPGNAPSAITVGALDTHFTDARSDDTVARYSSRGPTWYDAYAKPDILAPGSALTSTTSANGSILLENPQLEVDTGTVQGVPYIRLSGTSMATAVTTGVVAQMIQAHTVGSHGGRLTPNAIKALLQYSALPLAETDVLTQGAGSLNGDGAVALAASVDSTTGEGAWWLASPVSETSTISGEALLWSQRLVWGDWLVWGDQVYHNEEAWALRGPRLGGPPGLGRRLHRQRRLGVWGDRLVWGDLDDGAAGTMGVR